MNVKPVNDRVLVERVDSAATSKGGLFIPETARNPKEQSWPGIVRAVGPGKRGKDGKRVPLEVKEGDKVIVSRYAGDPMKLDGKDCWLASMEDVLAVVET